MSSGDHALQELQKNFMESTCPACGYHVAMPFFDGGKQPLATIAWPTSAEQAKMMQRLPLNFLRCTDCGHVYNASFESDRVPYANKPNLMYNKGVIWSEFIDDIIDVIISRFTGRRSMPTVIEVGYGDGSFLRTMAAKHPHGNYLGFDPYGSDYESDNPKYFKELFFPNQHLEKFRPEMIVTRHVLEHLVNPLGFLQQLRTIASWLGQPIDVYLEVPCIDQAIQTGRTVDFYYEHSSQFTSYSFSRMLQRSGAEIEQIGYGYGNEIIYGFIHYSADQTGNQPFVAESNHFQNISWRGLRIIQEQLAELHGRRKSVAVWGGTGKSAAFMTRYNMDAARFPVIVDSDLNKVGTFVPGTGQKIRYRDSLKLDPVDVLIIPPQWRARDIHKEIVSNGIEVGTILIEHGGKLVDFLQDSHPYLISSIGRG